MAKHENTVYINPVMGSLRVESNDEKLTALRFGHDLGASQVESTHPLLEKATRQLEQYFKGERKYFDLPLHFEGTAFEQKVWQKLQAIPFGSTQTYGQLAKAMGNKKKVRAVGKANGKNLFPVIIPCHRVIGAHGKLTGYSGGVERKEWLLKHEGALLI